MDEIRDLGSVSSKKNRATKILDALIKNYPLEHFSMAQNDYNGNYNIYTTDKNNEFMVAEFRGFMRGVIVERKWLE
jgi:hypothetical protein